MVDQELKEGNKWFPGLKEEDRVVFHDIFHSALAGVLEARGDEAVIENQRVDDPILI